jgi:hypothetical protein
MYAFTQDMPGISVDEQQALAAMIDLAQVDGCLAHVVGPIEGGCRMVDVWESEDAYRRFQREHLWPALRQLTEEQPLTDTRGTGPFTLLEVTGQGFAAAARA